MIRDVFEKALAEVLSRVIGFQKLLECIVAQLLRQTLSQSLNSTTIVRETRVAADHVLEEARRLFSS